MKKEKLLKKIVAAATLLPDNERADFLRSETQNDPILAEQVQILINQNKLESDLAHPFAKVDLNVGDDIGPYHILGILGQGGMGIVFLVEQKEPVQRRLALKVIKLGMDTKDVLARFELERRALALMSHPNVAAVFDAGVTDNGRPYFVMEYVPGVPITEYADQHNLSVKKRVELVIQACAGVLHAHQKGILHRDIKPGNVIVTEKDRVPLVKIIDFGVAKSTQQKLVSEALYTQLGVFIGTPNYTSPEQAGSSAMDVDTRTDVYSLGIILYEILVGKLPFSLDTFQGKSLLEVQQIIKEREVPTPYHRLKSSRFAKKKIATRRNSSYSELMRTLKGDLDCIIMHAIEKERVERYSSVSALSADLTRYLKGLPVEAQPHTTVYKVKRFVGRHKLLVGSLFSIVLSLSLGLWIALASLRQSEINSAHSAAVSSLINGVLVNANPWNKSHRNEITLNEVITELEKKLDNKELLSGVQFDKARSMGLENSLIRSLRKHIGDVQFSVGDFEAAEKNIRKAIILYDQGNSSEYLFQLELKLKLSNILQETGQLDEAEDLFNESINEIYPPQNKQQAQVLLTAVGIYETKNQKDKHIEFQTKLLTVAEQFFGKHSVHYVQQLLNLSTSHYLNYDLEKSLKLAKLAQLYSQELKPQNIDLEADARNKIVRILTSMGDSEQAVKEGEAFVEWSQTKYGQNHIRAIDAQLTLAYVYLWLGDAQKILEIVKIVEPMLASTVSSDHYLMQKLYDYRGSGLFLSDDFEAAIKIDEKALALAISKNNVPDIAYFSGKIGANAYYLGDLDKAQINMQRAIENETNKTGWNISAYLAELAQIHLANGNYSAAMAKSQDSINAEKINFFGYSVQGHMAFLQGDLTLATQYLRKAEQIYRDNFGTDNENYRMILSDLILVLCVDNKEKEALELVNSIDLTDSGSVSSAAIELVFLAAKLKNRINVDLKHAESLYRFIDNHWSQKTIQHKLARKAIELLGIII